MWDLVRRLGGQVRAVSGMRVVWLGWDMNAAFSLASALGYCPVAVAEILPKLEPIKIQAMNEQGSDD